MNFIPISDYRIFFGPEELKVKNIRLKKWYRPNGVFYFGSLPYVSFLEDEENGTTEFIEIIPQVMAKTLKGELYVDYSILMPSTYVRLLDRNFHNQKFNIPA